MLKVEGNFRHGTHYAWWNRMCRCRKCCDYHAADMRTWRAKRKAQGRPVPRGTDHPGFCGGCGVNRDQATDGCQRCETRHRNRRLRQELAA